VPPTTVTSSTVTPAAAARPNGPLNNGLIIGRGTERAIVQLGGVQSAVGGTLFLENNIDGSVVIRGSVRGIQPGTYSLDMHVNGDVADQCRRVGPRAM